MTRPTPRLALIALALIALALPRTSQPAAARVAAASEAEHDEHDEDQEHDEGAAHDEPGGHDAHERDDDHAGHDDHDEHADAGPPTVEALERFGVAVATAGPGEVDLGAELPGEIRPNGDRTAHVAPRFAGSVREVRARVGDTVRAGEVLAMVESTTLAPFPLSAPFDGVVVDRHVALGETTGPERPAFVVTDLGTVWVDIAVYQKDAALVHAGQAVTIVAGYDVGEADGTIAWVSPLLDQATRTATARVVLPNPSGAWKPGMFVTAHVREPAPAALVVPRTALMQRGNGTVVFVADAHGHYAERPVRVGRLGRLRAELLAGLAAGERYAATNAFLVKAELGKGAGGHDH